MAQVPITGAGADPSLCEILHERDVVLDTLFAALTDTVTSAGDMP